MSKIGYNQGNNPFKQTLGTGTAPGGVAHGKRGGTYNKNTAARPETEQEREARNKRSQNFINYLDLNNDGKAAAWEVGIEAASWIPTAVATFASTPSGPGAVGVGVATKTGIKKLLKKGIQLFAGSKTRRALTIGGTGYAKVGEAGKVEKKSEMQDSDYQPTSRDIPENEDATNIFDR